MKGFVSAIVLAVLAGFIVELVKPGTIPILRFLGVGSAKTMWTQDLAAIDALRWDGSSPNQRELLTTLTRLHLKDSPQLRHLRDQIFSEASTAPAIESKPGYVELSADTKMELSALAQKIKSEVIAQQATGSP